MLGILALITDTWFSPAHHLVTSCGPEWMKETGAVLLSTLRLIRFDMMNDFQGRFGSTRRPGQLPRLQTLCGQFESAKGSI